MKQSSKLGFSLIELSVVILIIGILVIGVTKGTRILNESRLKSAKSLTASSPVILNADNLAFWLDASSEKSVDEAERVNGGTVSIWRDINPITQSPFDFSSSGGSRPFYIRTATNGLPALRFDGTDSMTRATVYGSDLSKDGAQITVFAVVKYISPMHNSYIFRWDPGTRFNLEFTNSIGGAYFDLGTCCSPIARLNFSPTNFRDRTVIITGVRRPGGYGAFRVNGREYASSLTGLTSTLNLTQVSTMFMASGNRGDFNELILFRTGLKNSEIADIEKYLSAKWGIPLKGL